MISDSQIEELYKKLKNEETPDLWDRIEKSIEPKNIKKVKEDRRFLYKTAFGLVATIAIVFLLSKLNPLMMTKKSSNSDMTIEEPVAESTNTASDYETTQFYLSGKVEKIVNDDGKGYISIMVSEDTVFDSLTLMKGQKVDIFYDEAVNYIVGNSYSFNVTYNGVSIFLK